TTAPDDLLSWVIRHCSCTNHRLNPEHSVKSDFVWRLNERSGTQLYAKATRALGAGNNCLRNGEEKWQNEKTLRKRKPTKRRPLYRRAKAKTLPGVSPRHRLLS